VKSPDLVKKTELVEAWQHFGIRVQTAIEDVITVENETDRYNNRYGSELENMSFELVSDVEQRSILMEQNYAIKNVLPEIPIVAKIIDKISRSRNTRFRYVRSDAFL